jgi:hypothetical protein
MTDAMASHDAPARNASEAELKKFGALANRWWGECMRLRVSGGHSRMDERLAKDGRADVLHQGWFGAA